LKGKEVNQGSGWHPALLALCSFLGKRD